MTDDRPPHQAGEPGTGPTAGPTAGPTTGPTADPAGSAGAPFGGPHEVPPLTAFAWRNGLVRPGPGNGRLFVGVCGALGRATNTDPILWRVVIAVLALFGGIGIVLYLLGWVLLPADGDTATPVESVLGRGHSSTPAVLAVIISIACLISFGAVFSAPFRPGLLGGALVAIAVVLLLRDQRTKARSAPAGPVPPVPPTPTPPPYPAAQSHPGAPFAMTSDAPTTAEVPPVPPADPAYPAYPPPPYPPGASYPPAPPFAPRGPFVPVGPPPVPPTFGPPRVPAPKPPRPPRSRLSRIVFSVLLIVLGTMFALSELRWSIPVDAYFAAGLAVIGLGLVVGAWYGRARGLIAVGIIGAIALGSVSAADGLHGPGPIRTGTHTFAPAAVSQLQPAYRQDVGDMVLDLSKVDFTGQDVNVSAQVNLGNLKIVLPNTVDVVVVADVNVGNAQVFGENWNGLGLDQRTVTDNGTDGVGGGKLHIDASVDAGNLEVRR
jgi:phage shock protein PspC (stress-responsive transcriptional regulator)